MTALLQVRDLGVHFPVRAAPFARPATLRALDGVSFDVARGDIVGVVGESGSGKTTLGRAILRLVEPSAGSVHFDGTDLAGLSGRAMLPLRRRLQAVFQDPAGSLNPAMTVGAAIAEALAIHGLGTRRDRGERVALLLERVGLPADCARRGPQALSGGQRQRVGIARALAVGPDLIIADEAVSALDVSVQAQIVNLLGDLRAELGLAMVFIAHDLAVVEHLCDRVIVLYLGRVMEAGTVEQVFGNPRHPYTRALIDAAPRLGTGVGTRRQRTLLAGDPPSPIAPPSGCVFRTRCPEAIAACADVVPPLTGAGHQAACIRSDAS
ncbi:ABC transporter ATP-binding protein [Sandarakinorhabdus sp. DWP1-3-1]|uniref:ABC transporter ATP-binding protein n=1 Tax=Sandarakinorhabdus sp. DWP1-3-1 TaxID=2804627 RepID=UPI003CF748CD